MVNIREVMDEAFAIAYGNNWKPEFKVMYSDISDSYYVTDGDGGYVEIHLYEIIYNHDFAKALWGEPWAFFTVGQSGDTIGGSFINWKGHLANMVVSEDPFKYLKENI